LAATWNRAGEAPPPARRYTTSDRRWTEALRRTTLGAPFEETAMPEPHLRAADTDRAAVATALGEHMSAGRLTLAEYDERVTNAYAAKTFGDLAALTADLPPTGRPHIPAPAARPVTSGPTCGPGADWGRRGRERR
jgi:hypothetical protein